jgi:phosphoribosylanthranilate isomerase
VTAVGLFLNAPEDEVHGALGQMPNLVPQFHGDETPEYCDSFGRQYIKALGVGSKMPAASELLSFSSASSFLFDSNEPGALGGTGHAFDWTRIERKLPVQLILAGGLDVHNVTDAIRRVAPYAVDVSSGVEVSKGIKHQDSIRKFMRAVAEADAHSNQ